MNNFACMGNESFMFKHYMELFYIFDRKNIDAQHVMEEFDINQRTLNKDLDRLIPLARYFGTTLIINGSTITFRIDDHLRFDPLIDKARLMFYTHRRNINDYKIRLNEALLLMLIVDRPIAKEVLAQQLNYSLSNIRLELRRMESFGESFRLHPNAKNKALGQEIDKRFALLSALQYIDYHLMFLEYNQPDIARFLQQIDQIDTKATRHEFNQLLVNTGYHMSVERQTFITLLIAICVSRYRSGKRIDQDDRLKCDGSIRLRSIACRCLSKYGITDENEIELLARSILINIDDPTTPYSDQAIQLSKQLQDYLQKTWCITIPDALKDRFDFECQRLIWKHHLLLLTTHLFHYCDNPNYLYQNSLLTTISYGLTNIASTFFNCNVFRNHMNELTQLVHIALVSVVIPHPLTTVYYLPSYPYQYPLVKAQLQMINGLQINAIDYDQIDSLPAKSLIISDMMVQRRRGDITYITAYQGIQPKLIHTLQHYIKIALPIENYLNLSIIVHDFMVETIQQMIHRIESNYGFTNTIDLATLRISSYKSILVIIEPIDDDNDTLILSDLIKPIQYEKKHFNRLVALKYKPDPYKNRLIMPLLIDLKMENDSFTRLHDDPTMECIHQLIARRI